MGCYYSIEKEAKQQLNNPLTTTLNEAFEMGAKYILEAFKDSIGDFRRAFDKARKDGEDLDALEDALRELEGEIQLYK